MVEDLARWKAALCQRATELQETIKRLLEEHNIIRDTSLKTYKYILYMLIISNYLHYICIIKLMNKFYFF